MARNGTTYPVGDLQSMTGAFDGYRAQMGTSAYESAGVTRSSTPGTSNAPRTEYPTSGHKRPGDREVARRRIQQVIDADSGPVVFHQTEHNLQVAVEHPDLNDRDAHDIARQITTGLVVGAVSRAADPHAGYVGRGVRLAGPQGSLRWLMLGMGD